MSVFYRKDLTIWQICIYICYMDIKKIIATIIKAGAKDAIWFYRVLGFNTLADKFEAKVDEYAGTQALGEDTKPAMLIKWVVRVFLIGVILFIALKIKQLIKK